MDTFQTMAEIAATFVGLAGVVIAVAATGIRHSRDNTLLGIFAAALGALFFALFRSSTRTKEEVILVIISQPSIWLKIGVGAGFLITYSYQIYLLGLMWMLGVSMFYFVRYVLRLNDQIEGGT